jgi:2,3-bisphosphoglycerate-dependent phosphoglycerate mutase
MTDSQIRMRRRPLLAPLLLPLLALLAAGIAAFALSQWTRTTVVVLVRHAEAASSQTGDPDLSPGGESRAGRLGPFLQDALPAGEVDHLYAADTRRAQQTAASVANQFKLPINLLGSSDWAGLASRIRREHRGATVVVVGYAATLQGLASQLAGATVPLEEDDFGSIFVVVLPSPGQPKLLRLRYGDAPVPPNSKKTISPRRT